MSAGRHRSSVRESPRFALRTSVAVFSSAFPLRHLQSRLAKGLPSVLKLFLLHSFLPLVQVPPLSFCLSFFFFLLPYPGTWGVSCLLGGLRSSASVQYVFCRSCSTCRCISGVSVEGKVISTSYSSTIFPGKPLFLLLLFPPREVPLAFVVKLVCWC